MFRYYVGGEAASAKKHYTVGIFLGKMSGRVHDLLFYMVEKLRFWPVQGAKKKDNKARQKKLCVP